MTHPVRLVLSGFHAPVSAVLDRLVNQNGFTVIQVPTIGQVVSASMNPRLWHSAMDALMRCHPGPIAFVGGVRADHEWLLQRRAVLLHVSEKLSFEVSNGFGTSATSWVDRTPLAVHSLDAKLSFALSHCQVMLNDRKVG